MPDLLRLLGGGTDGTEEILEYLRGDLLPAAIRILNENTLPFQCSLFLTDKVPSNQRNLTDVRVRIGLLLEYELGKAINELLPTSVRHDLALTNVIANRFPDLAFRRRDGQLGVRFEVKALQTVAEEKSANFDTLLKDIRKGTDYVVVLLWDWSPYSEAVFQYPHVEAVFVLDAFQLAHIRDCYWLNRAPTNVGDGRQGFDLCFGVNCNSGRYNKEEGNYGKLMRLFSPDYEQYLLGEVQTGSTLKEYYRFTDTTYRLGHRRIMSEVSKAFCDGRGGEICFEDEHFPILGITDCEGEKLLQIGGISTPSNSEVIPQMKRHGVHRAILFNSKFRWQVKDANGVRLVQGSKPKEAQIWAKEVLHEGLATLPDQP